ncbi:MAG: rhomboid family intramembrane serine protease [Turicibacter sp.]|nr:rhomboid family intramembrane serine protease [Turicibacter sp.]
MEIRSDLAMNIISYLIKEENFIFVGNEQEIWLENLAHPSVQLIYLNQKKIYNDEQVNFLMGQLQQVRGKIRRRYLLWRLNVVILNLDDFSVPKLMGGKKWLQAISIIKPEDAAKSDPLKHMFPEIAHNPLDRSMGDLVVEIQNVTKSKALEIHHTLSFQKKPFATYGFILLTAVVFMWALHFVGMPFRTLAAIQFGAKYNPLIANGEYWRLITANVLHADIFHLLFNAIFIYQFGKILETVIGWWRMAILMLGSAIFGTLFSFAFVIQVSLGSSTVAYGILGGLLFLGIENRKMFMSMVRRLVAPIVAFSALWAFIDSNVDPFGHLGGFIGGFLIASLMGLPGYRQYINRFILAGASLGLLAVGLMSRGNALAVQTDFSSVNLALIFHYAEQGREGRALHLMEVFGLHDYLNP